jgi:hypothetical protein
MNASRELLVQNVIQFNSTNTNTLLPMLLKENGKSLQFQNRHIILMRQEL